LCAYTSRPDLATTDTWERDPAKSPVKASTNICGALVENIRILSNAYLTSQAYALLLNFPDGFCEMMCTSVGKI
jgi:hypothetical protein